MIAQQQQPASMSSASSSALVGTRRRRFLVACVACVFIATLALATSPMATAQYYAPGVGAGCVVTGNKLFSHGNYIRELLPAELSELEKYRREASDFRQRVDDAYANMELLMRNNGSMPTIPSRPTMPAFCSGPDTTLYILGGCTVQNNKVFIAGKYARDLNPIERTKLEEFARQMVAQNIAAMAAAFPQAQQQQQSTATGNTGSAGTAAPVSMTTAAPQTTTVSPVNEMGRQIALEFCTEF